MLTKLNLQMISVTSTLSEINADAGRFGFKESNQTQT